MKGHIRISSAWPPDLSTRMQPSMAADDLWCTTQNIRLEQPGQWVVYHGKIKATALRFLISNMQKGSGTPKYKLNIIGRHCAWFGTCTLAFHPHICELYIFTWKSSKSSLGVQLYVVHDKTIMMTAFCYVENNFDYEYNPYIVTGLNENLTEIEIIMELFTQRRHKAATKIVNAYLHARYNPEFSLCRRQLLRDYDDFVTMCQAVKS